MKPFAYSIISVSLGVLALLVGAFAPSADAATLIKPSNTLGLIGWWKFDEESGLVATDSSVNDNVGSLQNMDDTDWVIGKFATGLDFDGVDEYVNLGTDSSLSPTGAITLLGWIKPRSFGANGYGAIIERQYGVSYGFYIESGDSTLQFSVGVVDCIADFAGITADGLTWQHAAVAYDGTDAYFYINGIAAGTCNAPGELSADSDDTRIGNDDGNFAFFDGLIDDVRVYNRPLSQSEIRQIMRGDRVAKLSATPPVEGALAADLAVHYPFDSANLDWRTGLVEDATGGGNDGQLIGFATTSAPIDGRHGQGLLFDGSNDRIGTPFSVPGFGTSAFTFSAWVRGRPSSNGLIFAQNSDGLTDMGLIYIPGDGAFSYENESNATDPLGGWYYELADDERWHHLVLVEPYVTGDVDSATLYLDGVPVTGGYGGVNFSPGTQTMHVGGRLEGGLSWQGGLDDVRVYTRPLSVDEISKLYHSGRTAYSTTFAGRAPLQEGLAAWWTFDGPDTNWGSGRVTDKSGQGNHGYVVGLATSSAGVGGRAGQAFQFDGVNDYVDVSATVSNVQTISFWALPQDGSEPLVALSGTHSVEVSGGTIAANGFASPTVYVDNAQTDQLPVDGKWHRITVTTDTPFSASAIEIGRIGGSYLSGALDDVRLWSRALTAADIGELYDVTR